MDALVIETGAGYDERLLDALAELHQQAFPAHMRLSDPVAYFREGFLAEGSINIVLHSAAGKIAGHLLAFPQSSVYEELRQWDPAMRDDPGGLYLDLIQVHPRQRKRGAATRLFRLMALEAGKKGYAKLSMHARKTNRMDERIRKLFPGAHFLRTIENWFDTGEPFEYIETTLQFNLVYDRREMK